MRYRAVLSPLHLLTLLLILFLPACGSVGEGISPATPTPVPPTRTPFPPSPTPIPTAAIVNEELITMAAFQEEAARYQAAVQRDLNDEDFQIIIQNLIHQTLLAQAAKSEGYQVDQEELQNRMNRLSTGDLSLEDWLAENGYTRESFQANLEKSLAAAWMRDQVIADVPQEAEQILAQQILFYDQNLAASVYDTLSSGKNFEQLAAQYDPQTRGNLGWFPRGYLTIPELDEILFELESGEITEIIESEIGYHIIKVVDKQENRPLDPAVRQLLQKQALEAWLDRRWKLSTIEITLPQ